MIELSKTGVYLIDGKIIIEDDKRLNPEEVNNKLAKEGAHPVTKDSFDREKASASTIAAQILSEHNVSGERDSLKLRFDALASHDITYVGIIQTARASGLSEFPVPYVLTNCHNSLCAVGGTINEDDHLFGLSAAQKFGGIFVPAHLAVIHQYMREMMTGCGKMIMGSDSHTRYGALGTMGVGEGGPEIVKQLLERTYDLKYPEIIAVYLEGEPARGVGPQDVALAIIKAVFKSGYVKNKVMEFVGPGIAGLSVDYRNGIDVMTTETTCLSSIWCTDEKVEEYYRIHGRPEAYRRLEPKRVSYYDGLIRVDLSKIVPMIAMPFHPSNAYTIYEVNENAEEILRSVEAEGEKLLGNTGGFKLQNKIVGGRLQTDQGVVAGCAGGIFENICAMADIMDNSSIGDGEFSLSIYPASQPVYMELIKNGVAERLLATGATIRTAFCGPCFGAGDVPANGSISIRHTTRNFPNREGSKPDGGQLASVALMDARSIASTALNGGLLTPATEVDKPVSKVAYNFNRKVYENRVYRGFASPRPEKELRFGPNIADWPEMYPLPENLLLRMCAVILDPVTTTDELIPSGETSSYRSNPYKLAEFTLSRKVPQYVKKAKEVQLLELNRRHLITGGEVSDEVRKSLEEFLRIVKNVSGSDNLNLREFFSVTGLGSVIAAIKPGDGSAREQAASCQKVLGGWANIAVDYATKRYRSNVINWGMIPFTVDREELEKFNIDDYLYIPGIRKVLQSGEDIVDALVINGRNTRTVTLTLDHLSPDEREVILKGSLINYYAADK